MQERIVILKLNEERDEYTLTKQIPKDMKADIFKRIGSEFDKSQGMMSKEIIRGLNPELEKVYLPNLIGVAAESTDFPAKARDFWADYVITPTSKGLRLNIAMEERVTKDLDENGNPKKLMVPVNPDDYMRYQFALQSSKVAKTPEELENKSFFDFTLEDLGSVREKELADFEATDKATFIYAKLTSKFADNVDKIDWILEMTKEEGTFFDTDLGEVEKKMMFKQLADKRPNKLITLSEDKDLEDKAFLNRALTYLVITKEGNDYYYLNENMGSEEKGALSWLKKPEKSGSVAAIKSKLAQIIKDKKQ